MSTGVLYVGAILAALVVALVAVHSRRPPAPERTSPGDWFQTLPLSDFLPMVPRLPSVRRLWAPKRRGRQVA